MIRPTPKFLALAVILAVAGCGTTVTEQPGGGTGAAGGVGGGSSSSASSGGAGGPCESFVSCCDDATGAPVDPICPGGGAPECPSGAHWPEGGTCTPVAGTCSPGQPCAANKYCDYPDDRCGQGEPGLCVPRPEGCDLSYEPVCLCDGTVGGNACGGALSGQDLSITGGCQPPPGLFGCGPFFCEATAFYCRRLVSDVVGVPDEYSCHALPPACSGAPGCECLAQEPCGELCSADPAGNLTLTCPGG
ncbi:MAG: hypothetical protein HY744_27305 [Deltaproteobacteria bacterium]|nr:hypothetical protein [Deltaproteobacteria bacterium]